MIEIIKNYEVRFRWGFVPWLFIFETMSADFHKQYGWRLVVFGQVVIEKLEYGPIPGGGFKVHSERGEMKRRRAEGQ